MLLPLFPSARDAVGPVTAPFHRAACQIFGRTTGTSRPRSSRMIECTACLRNPVAQSRQAWRSRRRRRSDRGTSRPIPSACISERRQIAVEDIELNALPCCPCSTGRLIGDVSMIVLPGSRGSRRQRARSRLRSARISARWMRSKSPESARLPAAPVYLQPPLWRKQVDLPRILAALQGSPKRFIAEQRGISRFSPLQNRARPIMKFSRCVSD